MIISQPAFPFLARATGWAPLFPSWKELNDPLFTDRCPDDSLQAHELVLVIDDDLDDDPEDDQGGANFMCLTPDARVRSISCNIIEHVA